MKYEYDVRQFSWVKYETAWIFESEDGILCKILITTN